MYNRPAKREVMASKKGSRVDIYIIGSGTCVPSLKRGSPALAIKIEDKTLLFDGGSGTLRQLLRVGIRFQEIDYLFYTHFHPDHTGDLVHFLFASKYAPAYQREEPFFIVAPTGFIEFYERLKGAYREWIVPREGLMEIIEIDTVGDSARKFENFTIYTCPIRHTENSIGFRIEAKGCAVVYSGDSDYCDEFIRLAKDADVLICESAFPDGMKVSGHMTPSLAGKIGTLSQCKKLILTHFYPVCDEHDIYGQCRKEYKGELIIAEDLMKISV